MIDNEPSGGYRHKAGALGYRPEIDGLRSIAVLSVLIYHAQFVVGGGPLLAGGFLGVDVFFVISGYLITSLICQEYLAGGTFSYARFYERRARRLLPALMLVLLATLPLAWMLLLPSQLVDFARSMIASIFFGSNHYWHIVTQEYGAESSLLRPLLHTWSLAVEEQYYLVFPAMFLIMLRAGEKLLLPALAVIALASFLLAVATVGEHEAFAFYLLPTRLWELMAGSLVAVQAAPRRGAVVLHRVYPVAGLLMILASMAVFTLDDGHPGWITLVPVVGTVLVIRYASDFDLATRLLSTRGFVGVGLISYSLYLWHYPLLAFARVHDATPSTGVILACLAVAVLLSVLTYYLVEKPFRNRERRSLRSLVVAVSLGVLVLLAFAFATLSQDGFRGRFGELAEIYGKNEFDNKVLTREANSLWKELAVRDGYTEVRGKTGVGPSAHETEKLWFSDNDTTRKVLLVGNSHSRDLFNALYQNRELFPGSEFARFELRNRMLPEEIELLFPSPNFRAADLVVISFRLRAYTLEKLPAFIEQVLAHGKEIVLVSSYHGFSYIDGKPVFDWYIQQASARQEYSADKLNQLYYQHQLGDNQKFLNNRLKRMARKYGVAYVDKAEVACELARQRCFGVTPDGYKAYHDADHWTLRGAAFFGQRIHALGWLQQIE